MEVGGVHSTVIRARDNITRPEGRDPALFMQPKSGGSGDCHDANNPGKDQDASEEALHQGQAGEEIGACFGVKNIGKPCTGKPYARFDEGEQANLIMHRLVRHRQTKEAATDRLTLRSKGLFSTLPYKVFLCGLHSVPNIERLFLFLSSFASSLI